MTGGIPEQRGVAERLMDEMAERQRRREGRLCTIYKVAERIRRGMNQLTIRQHPNLDDYCAYVSNELWAEIISASRDVDFVEVYPNPGGTEVRIMGVPVKLDASLNTDNIRLRHEVVV